jgi:hypothetical protein
MKSVLVIGASIFFQNQKQQAEKIVNPQVDNGAFL